MRGYECMYYQTKDLIPNSNTACWAGISSYWDLIKPHGYIYIDHFKDERTEKYIPILIEVINKITPCELVSCKVKTPLSVDRKVLQKAATRELIKYKVITNDSNGKPIGSYYNVNLILLNFIRNLWNRMSAPTWLYGKGKDGWMSYIDTFFETLKNLAVDSYDPMKVLTEANKKAIDQYSNPISSGHSNIHPGCLIKTMDDFINWIDGKKSYAHTKYYLTTL